MRIRTNVHSPYAINGHQKCVRVRTSKKKDSPLRHQAVIWMLSPVTAPWWRQNVMSEQNTCRPLLIPGAVGLGEQGTHINIATQTHTQLYNRTPAESKWSCSCRWIQKGWKSHLRQRWSTLQDCTCQGLFSLTAIENTNWTRNSLLNLTSSCLSAFNTATLWGLTLTSRCEDNYSKDIMLTTFKISIIM